MIFNPMGFLLSRELVRPKLGSGGDNRLNQLGLLGAIAPNPIMGAMMATTVAQNEAPTSTGGGTVPPPPPPATHTVSTFSVALKRADGTTTALRSGDRLPDQSAQVSAPPPRLQLALSNTSNEPLVVSALPPAGFDLRPQGHIVIPASNAGKPGEQMLDLEMRTDIAGPSGGSLVLIILTAIGFPERMFLLGLSGTVIPGPECRIEGWKRDFNLGNVDQDAEVKPAVVKITPLNGSKVTASLHIDQPEFTFKVNNVAVQLPHDFAVETNPTDVEISMDSSQPGNRAAHLVLITDDDGQRMLAAGVQGKVKAAVP